MDLQLTDKVAVVTGANKGIGLAITKALVAEGARVVAGSLSTENLDGLDPAPNRTFSPRPLGVGSSLSTIAGGNGWQPATIRTGRSR